jgi:nucleoside-diphosphate-sugar epimerase
MNVGNNVVITGSRGFIGTTIRNNLEDAYEEFDLKLGSDHRDLVDRHGTLIYLSSWVKQNESIHRPVKYLENNLTALAQILTSNYFDRVIFPSSATVYDDEGNLEPNSVYGLTKLAGEKLIKMYCKEYWILRFANPVGAGDKRSIFWDLADSKINNKIFTIYNGRPIIRDYFHVSHISLVVNEILKGWWKPGIYNVGTGIATSCPEFLTSMCMKHDINYKLVEAPEDLLAGYVPTTNLLTAPKIDLEEVWLTYL